MANDTNGDSRGTSAESRGMDSGSSKGANQSGGKAEGGADSRTNSGPSSSSSKGANQSGAKAEGGADSRTNTGSSSSSGGSKNQSGSKANGADSNTGYTGSSYNSTSGLSSLGHSLGAAIGAIGGAIGTALGFNTASPNLGIGSLTGNPGVVAKEMRAAGYPEAGIAGFVGRLQTESFGRMDPKARNKGDATDGTDSVGIAQWNSSRLGALQSFSKENGMDPDSIEAQAKFAVHELSTTEAKAGKALMNAKSVDDGVKAAIGYERPAGYTQAVKSGDFSKVAGYNDTINNANAVASALRSAAPTATNDSDPYGATAAVNTSISKATGYADPQVTTQFRDNPAAPKAAQEKAAVTGSPTVASATPTNTTGPTPKADIPNTDPAASVPQKKDDLLGTLGTVLHAAVDPVGFLVGTVTGIGTDKKSNPDDPLGVATALSHLASGAPNGVKMDSSKNNSKGDTQTAATSPVDSGPASTNTLSIQDQFAQMSKDFFASKGVQSPGQTLQPLDIAMLAPFSWSKLTDTSTGKKA